jgi:hypothetical protein
MRGRKFADAKGFDWFSVSDHRSPTRGGDMDCCEAIATDRRGDGYDPHRLAARVLRRLPEPRLLASR